MSFLNIGKNRIKKKELKNRARREELSKATGIYFYPDLTAAKEGFPFLKYIINALALFGASFGSLYCVISAFELEMTVIPLAFTCVIFSLIFSFMYFSFKAKIITYLLVLFSVIGIGFGYFSVVNSGISAIRNHILKFIDEHGGLPFLREFNVSYNDEYIAMSIAVCVFAVALILLLNIFISEKMNLLMLFALTFPFVQLGMYFGYATSKLAMLLVAASWFLVAGVRFSNAYNGLTVNMESRSSVRKHKHRYGFITDSVNTAKVAAVWLMFILVITVPVFSVMPEDGFELSLPTDGLKTGTERVVKNYLSYGMTSIFTPDRKSSEPGHLSNVSSISFDGRTDLKVTTVNYRADRIYLRSFAGYDYNGYSLRWSRGIPSDTEQMFNYTANLLEQDFENSQITSVSRHRARVRLADPSLIGTGLNVPYYSALSHSGYRFITSGEVVREDSSGSNEEEYIFFTDDKGGNYSEIIENCKDEKLKESFARTAELIRKDAYSNAMRVPERNLPAIEKFCLAYGISADSDDVVSDVVSVLEDNFEYTLRPDKVPYGEDYVNFFLLASQKGYCQHFASAATLIFRYLGIPARYAEGYVVDRSDFYDSPALDTEKVEDWLTTPYRADTEVKEVSVPDYNAHAWAEIYVEGLGWKPVEATTAAVADDQQSLLSALFGGTNALISPAARELMENVRQIDTEKTKTSLTKLFFAFLIMLAAAYFIRMAVITLMRHRAFHTGNLRCDVGNSYAHLYLIEKFAGNTGDRELSYSEFTAMLENRGFTGEMSGKDLCGKIEKALFSGRSDEGVCRELKKTLRSLKNKAFMDMTVKQKFRFLFIKVLW
ncbi:MAG: transglutaminase-like domain-containing protein [Clostridia bacterium]|nr:transglutaminase-like domain-containing protein [Clostridia bacterium]